MNPQLRQISLQCTSSMGKPQMSQSWTSGGVPDRSGLLVPTFRGPLVWTSRLIAAPYPFSRTASSYLNRETISITAKDPRRGKRQLRAEAGLARSDDPLHGVAVQIALERVGPPLLRVEPNHHFLARIEQDPGHALPAVFDLPGSQDLHESSRFEEAWGCDLVQNRGLFPVLYH
jgi:hypothetical protein